MEKIDFNNYQEFAYSLASDKCKEQPILNGVLGLAGESGECADIVKKHLFQGHDLNKEKLLDENYVTSVARGKYLITKGDEQVYSLPEINQ